MDLQLDAPHSALGSDLSSLFRELHIPTRTHLFFQLLGTARPREKRSKAMRPSTPSQSSFNAKVHIKRAFVIATKTCLSDVGDCQNRLHHLLDLQYCIDGETKWDSGGCLCIPRGSTIGTFGQTVCAFLLSHFLISWNWLLVSFLSSSERNDIIM